MMAADAPIRTIRQTNALIRALVEQETIGHPFWISGVVTRCYRSDLGHVYFTLSDDSSSIDCMVRESVRGTLGAEINNGLEVEVYGGVAVYERTARIQIDVEMVRVIERPGYVMDASTLDKLKAQGLWPRTKHPLPAAIRTIGLVTSKQSDALHDFEDQYRSDGGTAAVRLTDVRLQGEQAVRDIAGAIERLSRERQVDVIVLIRGGGRAAELAVFNEMAIAEAICRSPIPVVTGIGHQRDETLADQLADVSCITPTAAGLHLARATAAEPDRPEDADQNAASSSRVTAVEQPAWPAEVKGSPRWLLYLVGILAIAVIVLVIMLVLAGSRA